jgi:hypothetical protein
VPVKQHARQTDQTGGVDRSMCANNCWQHSLKNNAVPFGTALWRKEAKSLLCIEPATDAQDRPLFFVATNCGGDRLADLLTDQLLCKRRLV